MSQFNGLISTLNLPEMQHPENRVPYRTRSGLKRLRSTPQGISSTQDKRHFEEKHKNIKIHR